MILVELLKPYSDLVARVSVKCRGVFVCLCGAGDDADLCSELLQESLDALRALPEATLFDEGTVSSVWLEVVERATKFLRSLFLLIQRCSSVSLFVHFPTSLLLFLRSVMCTEVPPPRATFRSRTSTWLWPSCWSWPCRGGLSGWLHMCTSAHNASLHHTATHKLQPHLCRCLSPVSCCRQSCCCSVCGRAAPGRWTTSAPPRELAPRCCRSCSASRTYMAPRRRPSPKKNPRWKQCEICSSSLQQHLII